MEESKGSSSPLELEQALPKPPPATAPPRSRQEILALKAGPAPLPAPQPTYKPLQTIKANSITSLLEYLDFLKPLLLSSNELIPFAVKTFEDLQARVREPDPPLRLETFELSVGNVRKFFPSAEPSIERVIQLLSYRKPILGQYIYLLDVLTVLVIVFRGPLEEKARWLFGWYNLSKTGVMTEVEHVILIKRVSDCLFRIKAIGRIDVTEEDANQIALEARVYKTVGGGSTGLQLKYLPGLTFDDFFRWTRESPESAVLVKFVRVQDRLVDALLALRSRIDAVGSIVEEMRLHREHAIHVPKMDMFPDLREHGSPLRIAFRASRSVTVLISAHGMDLGTSEAYVQCRKSRPVPDPLYSIPDSTMQRKIARGQRAIVSGLPMCCEREYSLTSYVRVPLRRAGVLRGGPLLRVDIAPLDPDSHYSFTVYTSAFRYPAIGADTPPLHDLEVGPVSVAVLPASLSLADCDGFVKSTPLLDQAHALVHTGTLCPIDAVFRQALLFADSDLARGTDREALARSMAASSEAIYSHEWAEAVGRLIGMCSAAAGTAAAHLSDLYPHHSRKQTFYHNGMGPWGSAEVRAQLVDLLGPELFPGVSRLLEAMYWRFASTTCPPRPVWSQGSVSLVFVRCANFSTASAYEDESDLANISAADLAEELVLQSLGAVGAEEDDGEAESGDSGLMEKLRDQLVLVLRSPLDLVAPKDSWLEETDDELELLSRPSSPLPFLTPHPQPQPQPVPQPQELSEPPPGPRLTGKHELLHGEYSSRRTLTAEEAAQIIAPDFNAGVPAPRSVASVANAAPTSRIRLQYALLRDPAHPDFDHGFEALVKALFVWLAAPSPSSSDSSRSSRQVRLVSSGWARGVNFEIVHSPTARRLEHICLLPTRLDGDAADPEVDRLLTRLRVSMPEDCVLTVLSASPLRAINLVQASAASPTVTFLPINKILDKALPALGIDPPTEALKIIDGPRLLRITSTEVHLVVSAVGYGKVRCTIYELPFEVDQRSAIGLVAAERDKLRFVGTSWQRCTKRRQMLFSFKLLLPYCNYCVALDPEDHIPRVAQFRTLYNASSTMSSIILAAVSEAEYSQPSAGVEKIAHLLDGIRPPAAPVHLVHHFSRRTRLTLGLDKPHRVDLQHLYSRAEVVHTLGRPRAIESVKDPYLRDSRPDIDLMPTYSDYESELTRVNLGSSGKFTRLAPRDGSDGCLVAMVMILDKIDVLFPLTENLLVIVQRPLVSFLQKQHDGRWLAEHQCRERMDLCCRLLESLLLWKARAPGRDCQVVTFAEVASVQVVTIGFRQPSEHYDHAASLGLLDKESLTEVAAEIMSSSVPYSDKDDASSIASEEQEEALILQKEGGGDLQFGLGWQEDETVERPRSLEGDAQVEMEGSVAPSGAGVSHDGRPGSALGSGQEGSKVLAAAPETGDDGSLALSRESNSLARAEEQGQALVDPGEGPGSGDGDAGIELDGERGEFGLAGEG